MLRRDRISIARELAATWLASPRWTAVDLSRVAADALGLRRSPRWLSRLSREVVERFGSTPPHGRDRAIAALVEPRLRRLRIAGEARRPLFVHPCLAPATQGDPAISGLDRATLPALATRADVADWLCLDRARLDVLADERGLSRGTREGPALHYRYRWIPKRPGGARLLEIPKPDLARVQRHILRQLLDRVPPHACAMGFRRGRSVVDHARAHVGRDVVVRLDLTDFFGSIASARVHAIFAALGYPWAVARVLTALVTHRTSRTARRAPIAPDAWARLRDRHLPQGAPCSPAIANLAAFGLDVRLSALARSAGAVYTRYADDLVLSGDASLARSAPRWIAIAHAVAIEEGFAPNFRKTRVMRASTRQHVTGIVVNARPSLPRDELDRLKATLHNCVVHGPASQNRDGRADFRAWLLGRVAWVAAVHPERGAKLRALFDRITW